MYSYNCSPIVTNCFFIDNNSLDGGGMYNSDVSLLITNCVFSGNEGTYNGGGIFNGDESSTTLINCTFTKNTSNYGGGMHNVGEYTRITLINCIFWGNEAVFYGNEIHNFDPDPNFSYCDISYCDINDCYINWVWDSNLGYDGGGNIDEDPCFVNINNPDGNDGDFGTWDDGLRLALDSPCIDAADGNVAPSTDILGFWRGALLADIGAYEFGVGQIVVMVWIDESTPYQNSSTYEADLVNYRALLNSGDVSIVQSGCLVPGMPIAGVLPSGYSPPPEISVEESNRQPDLNEIIADFDRIRDGVPDYLCLSVGKSGSMSSPPPAPGPGYDEFKSWIANNYPDTIVKTRDVDEFDNERWVEEMKIQVQSVLDE